MTQLLLIDCKTMLVARYDGRRQDSQLARIDFIGGADVDEKTLQHLDEFRRLGRQAVLPVVTL